MKKLACSVIAIMLVAVSFCAFADTFSVEIDYEGEYVTFDDVFSLYLPNTFEDGEITEEMEESGIFAYYLDPENTLAMTVQWFMSDTAQTLEEAQKQLEVDSNYTNVSRMDFNSIPFVVYDTTTSNAFGCLCADEAGEGGFYAFSFAADTDVGYGMALKIMSTIQ